MTKAAAICLYQNDFISFVELAFKITFPGKKLQKNWHHEIIAQYLENCRSNGLTRLIITAPPRSLKSFIASVAFPAFVLGKNPTMNIMSIVANRDLVTDIVDRLARLMQSPRYCSLFPHMRATQARGQIKTNHGGSFTSTPLYISPIGRGADMIILDDPMSPTDARDRRLTEKAFNWLSAEVFTRLNDKASAAVILVMQRLDPYDLSARYSDWHTLKFSAIARHPEHHILADGTRWLRPARDVLCPAVEDLQSLYDTYRVLGIKGFMAQYLQDPIANEYINDEVFYDYDSKNWTKDGPQPESLRMFSIVRYIQYECFGIGRKPPYNPKRPITEDQYQQYVIYSQAKLMAECAEDCL